MLGNLILYLLSRAIPVMVPVIRYDSSGNKWYTWNAEHTGYSFRYFIQQHRLETLTAALWLLILVGLAIAFLNRNFIQAILRKRPFLRKRNPASPSLHPDDCTDTQSGNSYQEKTDNCLSPR